MAECIKCRSFQFCQWATPPDIICSSFKPRAQTNADRIRAMSEREFAEWLDAVSKAWYDEGYTKETDAPLMSPYPSTASKWIEWLKEKVHDS